MKLLVAWLAWPGMIRAIFAFYILSLGPLLWSVKATGLTQRAPIQCIKLYGMPASAISKADPQARMMIWGYTDWFVPPSK